MGDFKRDADGSDKRFGFALPPDLGGDNHTNGHTLLVYESPIDAISHAQINPDLSGRRLSLGGTALSALAHFMEIHPEIRRVVVCTDNDEAGNRAAAEIAKKFGTQYKISRLFPSDGAKDWNETLQNQIRIEVIPMEDKRKDIIFRDPDYKEKFRVKDGDSIKVTLGYDGEVVTRKCRWIDEAHTKIGGEYYHNDEYAEKSALAGNKIEPVAATKPTIDILAAKYDEALQDVQIPMTKAALRKLVGGSFEMETLTYPNRTEQIGDRTVEIKGRAYGAVLRGNDGIAVCGLTDGVLTSLHPYNAQTCKRDLSPAMLAQNAPAPKKPSLLGNLDAKKAIAAEQKSNGEPTKTKSHDSPEV
jgi:5S rRNA maturation endonuclease (ribonuclease M5)